MKISRINTPLSTAPKCHYILCQIFNTSKKCQKPLLYAKFCQKDFTNFPFKNKKTVKTFSICGKNYKEDNDRSKYRLRITECHYILCQIFKKPSPFVSRKPLSNSTMLNLHCSIPLNLANFKNYHVKNKMAKIFPFRNMKTFLYLKYEKFHLQICLEFYISLIK